MLRFKECEFILFHTIVFSISSLIEMDTGKKKVEYLVVDTSAFIKNAPLQDIGENLLTVPEVVSEIKNKRQLRRLAVLPYDLVVKDTFPEHVKFVTEFSKKTGDYPSLSATDIQVIALTYQLEKEKVGIDHLNEAPPVTKPIIEAKPLPPDAKTIAGFYVPKKKKNLTQKSESDSQSVNENEESYTGDVESESEESVYDSAEEEIINEEEKREDDEEREEEANDQNGVKESHEIDDKIYDQILKKVEDDDSGSYDNEEEEEEDDDGGGGGWITPSNIKEAKNTLSQDVVQECEGIVVACLTTDFAMQNVLKQIGLKVVTLDGKLIKQLRTFILRCYGCFKTTSVMTHVFCPNCGYKTLKKVAVTVTPDGVQKLHINFKRPLTARGKKYSVPLFRGGKHSNNPILSADQPMPQQRISKMSRQRNNPLDDDWIAGFSPFVTRDVTSKSAMLGLRPQTEIKHWMRRNPNESRPTGKKNKKRR